MWNKADEQGETEAEELLVFGLTPKEYAAVHNSGKFKANIKENTEITSEMMRKDLKYSGKCTDKIIILHTGITIRIW
jgi:hypothetical protein